MTQQYQQTNTNSACTPSGGWNFSKVASIGGAAGGAQSITVPSSGTYGFIITLNVGAVTTVPSGDFTWRLNCTTANMNVTISTVDLRRDTSACVIVSNLVSSSPGTSLGSTGVKSGTLNNAVADSVTAGDIISIAVVLSNGAMSDQVVGITFDQFIDTPDFAASTKTLVPNSVAWSWAATAVTPKLARKLIPDTLAWSWTQQNVTLRRNLPLVPNSVAWASTVTDATLRQARKIAPDSLSWSWSATDVGLNKGRRIIPDSVSWSWSAQDVTLKHGKELVPDSLAWSWAAANVTLRRNLPLVPESVSWAWTAADVTLRHAHKIVPESVAWSWSAADVTLRHGFKIVPEGVAWSWSSTDVTLTAGNNKALVPDSVAWSWTAEDATLRQTRKIVPEDVAWMWSSQDVSLEHGKEIVPDSVDWSWLTTDVTLTYAPSSGTARAPSYGGHTPEDEERWLAAANKLMELKRQLEEAKTQPAAEQVAVVRAAAKVIEQVETDTGIDVMVPSYDYRPALAQLEAIKAEVTEFVRLLERRERTRRNNNWLMLQ